MNNDFVKALEVEIRREETDFADLMNDFEFVKELNKELSLKYQDFVDSLPTVEEIDLLLAELTPLLYKNIDEMRKRKFQLKRFRSAVVLLSKDDPKNKPIKYEELFGVKP